MSDRILHPHRPARAVRWLLVSAIVLLPAAAVAADVDETPWPTKRWTRSTPEEHGLDATRLDELVKLIDADEQFPDLHSLLIVRHDRLVLEEYFDGHTAGELHMLQSVTKSFTSAAVGIAIGREKIKSVDERVLSFFDDLEGVENIDDRKRAMTLEDLLTMRSGTDYHERGPDSPHYELNAMHRGWDAFILSRPMINEPGEKFQYDSGAVILMSSIIKARTGAHADNLLDEHLFKPLGIRRSRWYRNFEGHPHTGGGLHLRSRDMAKLGLLYLHDGKWEGKQVVPSEWVEASTKRHVEFEPGHEPWMGYGYWWWMLQPAQEGEGHPYVYAACGRHAQYIFVVPEHDMVVVVTGNTSDEDMRTPVDFLYSHILPAVQD